jgi:hypothetical protein
VTEKLSDAELDSVRGGFVTTGGFTFAFGAVVSTYVNGSLALQSTLNLNSQGSEVTNSYGSAAGVQPLSSAPVAGVNVAGLPGAGVVIQGSGGETVVIQDVSPSQLVNLVINTANNQVIRQDTAITLTLGNLQAIEAAAAQAQVTSQIQNALASATMLRGR